MEKFNWKLEAAPAVVFILLSLGVFQQTSHLKGIESAFPRLVAVIMLAASAVLLVNTLVRRAPVVNVSGMRPLRVLAVVAMMVLYILLLPYAGYILCSIALGGGLTLLLGYRRLWVVLIGSTVFTAVVFVVFNVFLKVPLPTLF